MSVGSGRGQLLDALKTLRAAWDEAAKHWNDPVARQFEEDFWQPLDAQVTQTVAALDRLAQLLARVRQDCGGREIF